MSDESMSAAGGADGLTCQLCGVSLTPRSALAVSGHAACQGCVDQLQAELADSQAGASAAPMGLLGALVGAALGALAWAGIAVATDMEIGYVAVLVGFLAGKGASLFTGGGHGQLLQGLAVVGALAGLLAAKFAIYSYYAVTYVEEEYGETLGWFDEQIVANFGEALGEMTGLFDLLWVALAVGAAWRVPASPVLHVETP